MKARTCPHCKNEVLKYHINPINEEMLVGYCRTCRKTVNLGKPGRDDQPSAPAIVNAGRQTQAPIQAQKKEGKKTGKPGRPRKHIEPVREPVPAHPAPAKRNGFRARIAEFFEFD
jgi:hypothetical protein